MAQNEDESPWDLLKSLIPTSRIQKLMELLLDTYGIPATLGLAILFGCLYIFKELKAETPQAETVLLITSWAIIVVIAAFVILFLIEVLKNIFRK